MFGSGSSRGTRAVRLAVVLLQVFLLVFSTIAPAAALAADPSGSPDPAASASPTPEPSPSSEPVVSPMPDATVSPDPTPAPVPDPTPAPTIDPTPSVSPSAPPSIASDKADYAPGELVTLTGAGWQPGEEVHVNVNDDWGSTWTHDVYVHADAQGAFTDQFNLPDWFVAHYSVQATGPQSGAALAVFTDASLAVAAAPAGVSFTLTFQGFSDPACGTPVSGSNGNVQTSTVTAGTNLSISFGSAAYEKLTAGAALTPSGATFASWSGPSGFSSTSAAACVATPSGGTNAIYTATFSANAAPVANADSYTTSEDAALTVATPGILANDTDADGNPLSAVLVTGPSHGTLALNANGSFTYTPAANYNGPDSFTYKASDGTADSNVATVSITVNPVDDAPAAVNDTATVTEDSSASEIDVLGNDTDIDGGPKSVASVTQGTNGSVAITGGGSGVSYTPVANYCGSDSFTYTLNGGSTATVNVTVSCVNDAPVAANDSYSTGEDTALSVVLPGILGNDSDVDSPTLTAALVAGPANGTLTLNANGSFTYTPAANYNGPDSFTYKANDGSADSNVATVTISVSAVNDPPVGNDDTVLATEDTALTIAAASLTGNDTDIDGDTLTITAVGTATGGSIVLNGDGSVTYTPAANLCGIGAGSFQYTVSDGHGGTDSAGAAVNITCVNDAPVAVNESYVTDEDTALVVGAAGVLANDTDVDSAALTAVLVSGPAHGSLTLNANGSFTYTPAANYNGPDSFTYKANDSLADSNVATVSLTVNPVNDAPVVVVSGDFGTVDEGATRTYTYTATDVDGDALTVVESCGTDADYVADLDPNSFACTFRDGPGSSVVNVTASDGSVTSGDPHDTTIANVAPTIGSVLATPNPVDEASATTVTVSATDPAGVNDPLAYEFDCNNDATYEVGPQAAHSATCTFNDGPATRTVGVRVTDGDGGATTDSVDLTVLNVAPTATFTNGGAVDEGSAGTVSFSGQADVSPADTTAGFTYSYDFDNDGTFELEDVSDASVTVPAGYLADGPGTRQVRGRIIDKDGGFTDYTTDITINNVAPTVLVTGAPGSSPEGTAISLGSAVSDPSSVDTAAGFSYAWTVTKNGSPFAAGTSASLTFTPDDNGTYVASLSVTDKDGGTGTDSRTITVTNVAPTATLANDGPVNEGSLATVSFGDQADPSSVDTAAGFHYAYSCTNGDLSGATYAASGTAANTTCTFADNGTYPVKARIIDKDGGSTELTTSVTVNNVAPTADLEVGSPIDEGSSSVVSLTNPFDPSSVDTTAGYRYSFACDGFAAALATTYAAADPGTSASCLFDDNGSYTVLARILDKDDGFRDYTATVSVTNVPPTATLVAESPITEGTSSTLHFDAVSDPSGADIAAGLRYSFACDGLISSLVGAYASANPTNSAGCAYADNGDYGVAGRILDKDNGQFTSGASVHVANVAPTVTAGPNRTVNEGSLVSFVLGSFSDPGFSDGPWVVDVAWGDLSTTSFSSVSQGPLGTRDHTYADNGTYTVTVSATDKDSGVGSATFTVTVTNVAPTASLSNDGPVNEGSLATVSFGDQADPSSVDTAAGFHYAYSCTNGDLSGATYAASGTAANTTCTFADNGTYPVKARIIDKDGGSTELTTSVTVNNVAPTVTNVTLAWDPFTHTATATAAFTDVGVPDTHTAAFTWNQAGIQSAPNVTESGGNGTATNSIVLGPGCYALSVDVAITDDDGGIGTGSGSMTGSVDAYDVQFRAPIKSNERNLAKAGSTVPVKIVVYSMCVSGTTVTSVDLYVAMAAGQDVADTVIDGTNLVADSGSSNDNGLKMRVADGGYIYNLSTKGLSNTADYTLRIRLGSATGTIIKKGILRTYK